MHKPHWLSKPNTPGAPPPNARPLSGEPDVGLELWLLWESLWDTVFSCLQVAHLAGMGLLISQKSPSYCLNVPSSLSLHVGNLFWLLPVYFIDGCWAVSCNFGAFKRGDELESFSSTILSENPIIYCLCPFLLYWCTHQCWHSQNFLASIVSLVIQVDYPLEWATSILGMKTEGQSDLSYSSGSDNLQKSTSHWFLLEEDH